MSEQKVSDFNSGEITNRGDIDIDELEFEKLKDMLVKSLLILIYAEFEKCFNKLVLDRCSEITDISILEFIKNNSSIRSLKLSSIRGFIGQFGEKHKNEFKRLVGENSLVF